MTCLTARKLQRGQEPQTERPRGGWGGRGVRNELQVGSAKQLKGHACARLPLPGATRPADRLERSPGKTASPDRPGPALAPSAPWLSAVPGVLSSVAWLAEQTIPRPWET